MTQKAFLPGIARMNTQLDTLRKSQATFRERFTRFNSRQAYQAGELTGIRKGLWAGFVMGIVVGVLATLMTCAAMHA